MTYRQQQIDRDCPVDECAGQISYFTEEGENGPYADGSYQTWTYLLMDGSHRCSEGHTFDDVVVDKMEADATNDYQQSFYSDEP